MSRQITTFLESLYVQRDRMNTAIAALELLATETPRRGRPPKILAHLRKNALRDGLSVPENGAFAVGRSSAR